MNRLTALSKTRQSGRMITTQCNPIAIGKQAAILQMESTFVL